MAVELKSAFFDDVEDLIYEKDNLLRDSSDKRERVKMVRAFNNGMDTMTKEEAEKEGRTEITNHMMAYDNITRLEDRNYAIYATSKSLYEVIIDTDNPELDFVLTGIFSEALNEVIYLKGKFGALWRSVSGELPLTGIAPLTYENGRGWCPRMAPNMLFPKGTALLAEKVTYAFEPRELTFAEIKKLLKSVEDVESGEFIDKQALQEMVDALKENIQNNNREAQNSFEDNSENAGSVHDENKCYKEERKTTFNCWYYYELTYEGDSPKVSRTLFLETHQLGDRSIKSRIISHEPEAYDHPESFLNFIVSDSEVGGVKTVDACKGIAELTYNSDLDREELFNELMEGAKERARPKYQFEDDSDVDKILSWNPTESSIVPKGLKDFAVTRSGNELAGPMSLLAQTSASITDGNVSNTGRSGESRNQTLERQRNSNSKGSNRTADTYKHLDILGTEIVRRFMEGEVKKGTDDWDDILWFRNRLEEKITEKYKFDWKMLAKREFNRFKYVKVRAVRNLGDGDRDSELEISKWLMDQYSRFQPQIRPYILQRATLAVTKDADLAEFVSRKPEIIVNSQKIMAEGEYNTIERRAALGQVMPIGADDIHQDHIPIHIMDMRAHLQTAQIRQWDQLDLIQFSAMVEHVGLHLQVLLEDETTNGEAKQFTQALQQTVDEAQGILNEVQERVGSEEQQLTAKEQADLQIKIDKLGLDAQKLGLEQAKFQELVRAREARHSLIARGQAFSEIDSNRKFRKDVVKDVSDRKDKNTENKTPTE